MSQDHPYSLGVRVEMFTAYAIASQAINSNDGIEVGFGITRALNNGYIIQGKYFLDKPISKNNKLFASFSVGPHLGIFNTDEKIDGLIHKRRSLLLAGLNTYGGLKYKPLLSKIVDSMGLGIVYHYGPIYDYPIELSANIQFKIFK